VDGKNFQAVEHIQGAGTSNTLLTYLTVDDNPAIGISYYRLKQTDIDGRVEYFRAVPVEFEEEVIDQTICLAPNPFSTYFKLDFTLNRDERVDVSIISIDGRRVFCELMEASIGANHFNYSDGNQLSRGVYFVNVQGESTNLSLQAIKN